MNINALSYIIGFGVMTLLSRGAVRWIRNLSYDSAGQSMRKVEKHYNDVKEKKIPYEKEITWLARVSVRPLTTRFLYYLYDLYKYVGLAGLAVSVIALFVPVLNTYLGKAVIAYFALCIFSALIGVVLYEPIKYLVFKNER